MTDNFSTSIRDLQNIPDLQDPIQYETNKGRLDMDTEIHQARSMANNINKKLEDYRENIQEPEHEPFINVEQPKPSIISKLKLNSLSSLKDFSNKNDLIVIFVLVFIMFSKQVWDMIGKYIPSILKMPDLILLLVKAILVTVFYHVIKKVVL